MNRKKLIEVALPLDLIDDGVATEKSPFLPNHARNLHLWWARRPLAACRAVLFASLVDDPSADLERFPTAKAQDDERQRLFSIIGRLVQWKNTTNETVLDEARAEIRRSSGGSPPLVIDPFSGGGSIPLEAQRLGLTTHASDLNPVAVLITKSLVEIPPRFAGLPPVHPDARAGLGDSGAWGGADGLAEDIRRYAAWIQEEARRRIGSLYPPLSTETGQTTVLAWLWARTVTCPNPACRARMPLVRSFALSSKKGKQAWVKPVIDREAKVVRFEVRTGTGAPPDPPKVGRGAQFRCLVCEQIAPDEHIKAEGRAGRMGTQLMAMVGQGRGSRLFQAPSSDHEAVAEAARPTWGPDQEIADDPRALWTVNYGLVRFRDLFTPRQLVALTTFSDLIPEVRAQALRDAVSSGRRDDGVRLAAGGGSATAYADAIATYLAMAVDQATRYHVSICTWNVTNLNVAQAFGRQAIPMSWDFAEANPLDGPLAFSTTAEWVANAVQSVSTTPSGTSTQQDAASAAWPIGAVFCTDPPYYDNIGYADLSDFFYVWLRRSLLDVYPELFTTLVTPKSAELIASPYRFGGQKRTAERHFEVGLRDAFRRMREACDESYPVTIFYAFKQAESEGADSGGGIASTGWETILSGLVDAGFSITGTWPIRTERVRGLKSNVGALASSIVMVCRPRSAGAPITTRRDFIATLHRELPEALRNLQRGNIAPVDLAQASIGPGMAAFSRFAKVLETDGSTMTIRTALALINQALDEILAEQEGEFDADTRWAIAWYEQYGFSDAEFGFAETLSKAKNTSVGGLVEAGIVAAQKGRVRLLARQELSPAWSPATDGRVPVWEVTQRVVQVLLTGGESAAADLLSQLGGLGESARDLAYRLYHVALRKGWTDEARALNALVVAWSDLATGAEAARSTRPVQAELGLE